MDLLNPTPTLRPSAENILAETEKGRRTDSPERVNQSIPTVSQPTGSRNIPKDPIRTRNTQKVPTGEVTHAGAGNSQKNPTQNSVINPTETRNSVKNPTGSVQVRSPIGTGNSSTGTGNGPTGNGNRLTGTGNAQKSNKVKNYFWGKKKEVKFSGKCLLPGEKYSSQTEKVNISERYSSEQTRLGEYSV